MGKTSKYGAPFGFYLGSDKAESLPVRLGDAHEEVHSGTKRS